MAKIINNVIKVPNERHKAITKQFEDKIIGHSLLNISLSRIMHAIAFPKGASMVYLFGPTGVGKTTVLNKIAERLEKHSFVYIPTNSPATGVFGWFDFFKRLLIDLDSRIIDLRIGYEEMNVRRLGNGKLHIDRSASVADLRAAVIQAMIHVRPAVIFIDELPHIKKGVGTRVIDQMDALKSWIDEVQLMLSKLNIIPVFVLAGTYEMLGMMSLNGQLGRRSIKVPFQRYDLNNESHIKAFQGIIRSFQEAMVFPKAPDLISMYKYLYVGSLGCVGTLKQWLNRSYSMAIVDEQPTLTYKYLKVCALDQADMIKISDEIAKGEADLKRMRGELSTVYLNLGIPSDHLPGIEQLELEGGMDDEILS